MHCDVLAGEQGPSCHSTKQIPDFKVIYVRFIESNVVDVDKVEGISSSNEDYVGAKKRKQKCVIENKHRHTGQEILGERTLVYPTGLLDTNVAGRSRGILPRENFEM